MICTSIRLIFKQDISAKFVHGQNEKLTQRNDCDIIKSQKSKGGPHNEKNKYNKNNNFPARCSRYARCDKLRTV